MTTLLQDLRYAFRTLRKSPGFAAVAILTLGLGIGANTAIFSVVENVLLRSLPYQNSQSLVQVWNDYPPAWRDLGLSPGDFYDWRQHTKSFTDMAAYVDVAQGFNLTGEGDPQRVQATFATYNLFSVLGVRQTVGRDFTPEEDKTGSAPVVILTHKFWQRRYGADPAIVGRAITLDNAGYRVIGVLPANFEIAKWADVWLPAAQYPDDLTGRVHHPFAVIARLHPAISIAQAQAEVVELNHQTGATFADTHKNWQVSVKPLEDLSAAKVRTALLVLFGAVGLVLLIACANMINLLLARNAARQKEIALRVTLGASSARIAVQLLTESVLLSLLGGAVGLGLAYAGLRAMAAFVPEELASVNGSGLNLRVLGFTASVSLLAGIFCGLVPVLQTLRRNLQGVLKEGGKTSSGGGNRLRNALVVAEIALALTPLIGAGLLLRSFRSLLDVTPGFRVDHILTMEVNQPNISNADFNKLSPAQQLELPRTQALQFQQIAAQLQSLPGVKAVGGITVLPLKTSLVSASRFLIEGQPIPAAGARPVAQTRTASLGYFDAVQIPLLRGRLFVEDDWLASNIIINEAMARRFWPGGDPLGKRVNLCSLNPQPCWLSVVGIVGNVHQLGLDAPPSFDVYFSGGWTPYIVMRTSSDPTALAQAAMQSIHKVDPNLPVEHVMAMDGLLSDSVSPRRFSAVLLGIFAALALLLAAVGIYGVMSYVVSLRTNEIGVRRALGAQSADIWKLIVGRGAKLIFAGVGIGLLGAAAFTRLLSSLLFGVRAIDPLTFASVAAILIFVALAACYLPARRAMRVDPMIAIRYE